MKIDLGFGNSVAVREAFLGTYEPKKELEPLVYFHDLYSYNYPNHEGHPKLVEITKKVIERQTGQTYRHVFLVNGATGGVTIALRAFHQSGLKYCITREAPFYVRYPSMIKASGMKQVQENARNPISHKVGLLDLPSNPLGLISTIGSVGMPMIIDGVYLSRVYAPVFYGLPRHDVMIGSYSKLLGINGIRVGWLATNDDLLAERFKDLVISEYCGLSQASTDILIKVLDGFQWDRFETYAKLKLNYNREQWTRLEKFFDYTPVSNIGMFYYSSMDQKAQELFNRANVTWTKGSSLGTDDIFARFNLGASNEQISEAVKTILKLDRI